MSLFGLHASCVLGKLVSFLASVSPLTSDNYTNIPIDMRETQLTYKCGNGDSQSSVMSQECAMLGTIVGNFAVFLIMDKEPKGAWDP
jgi:hypothetical protein